MSQPESNNIGINDAWSLMKILYAIKQMFQTVAGWFSSPSAENFPQDESGELMRRYMARQSWFDKISYDWTNRSFFQKATFIIGLTLFSGLVGLFLGAPTIIALSVGFIALTLHSLLVSHEQERQASAKIFAAEAVALNTDLRESKKVFNEKSVELGNHAQELQKINETANNQLSLLKSENQKIIQQNSELISQTESLQTKAAELTEQHTAVEVKFKEMSTHLENCSQEVVRTTATVATIGNTVSDFSEAAKDIRQSQTVFSQAANSFCLFVAEQPRQKIVVACEEDSSDDFLNHLLQQNEEDDALLESLGLDANHSTQIP